MTSKQKKKENQQDVWSRPEVHPSRTSRLFVQPSQKIIVLSQKAIFYMSLYTKYEGEKTYSCIVLKYMAQLDVLIFIALVSIRDGSNNGSSYLR